MNIRKLQNKIAKSRALSISDEEWQERVNQAYSYILVAYTIQNAADVLTRKANDIMLGVKSEMVREEKRTAGNIVRNLEAAVKNFDKISSGEQGVDKVFFETLGAGSYDAIRGNSYEVVRFLMLFYTRTCSDIKATNQLAAYMERMKSNGIFSDEEIAEFRMR